MELSAYQQFADLEEEHFWFRGRRSIFFAILDKLYHGRKDLEILEVGCGAGGLLKRLSIYGNAKGLELWPELCKLAKDRSGQSMICGNAYAIPLADQSQDLICLFDTIEHIPDEGQALAEIQRVLKPGGRVFFSVPAYQFLFSNNDRVAHHCRRYTKGRLQKVCKAAALEAEKLSYFNSFLFPLILPAVLLAKGKEKWIGLKDENKTNLSRVFPGPINATFAGIMSSERHLLRHMNFPVGHSLLGVFRRPTPPSGRLEP